MKGILKTFRLGHQFISFIVLYVQFFHFRLNIPKGKTIYFIDIDNTIAETGANIDPKFYLHIKPNFALIEFINIKLDSDSVIVVLTARKLRYHFVSKKWLNEHTSWKYFLYSLGNVYSKSLFIDSIKSKSLLFDDFSYNHENGEILYYDKLIAKYSACQNVDFYRIEVA